MDEIRLVAMAAAGNADSFEQLVLLYQKKVYSMAYHMTGSHFDAQDVTQEAFLRVYRSLSGFKSDSKFSTWLYKIVSNLCIDCNRKKKHTLPLYIEDGNGEESVIEIPDNGGSPETALERSELGLELLNAVRGLSEEHRQIFIMREISGMSYGEIGEALLIEEGTVKSRIYRAREKLREALLLRGNIPENYSSKKRND
ncbi:MAG: sigma-70 family RNA polymerase sigma factor [Oscillospiraceae bacterium]|nr:sigma-70 family RNA polymerase sigma factor [Oscillospiraceae bacterium]